MRKIDPVLYDLLDRFLMDWEDFDTAREAPETRISRLLDELYQRLKQWMTGKKFAVPVEG